MDCDSCLEVYDQAERVPKIVPCGHTVCLRCLERSDRKECPTCYRYFFNPPDALPNNFTLLRLMLRSGRPSPRLVLGLPRRRRGPLLGDDAQPEKRRRVEWWGSPACNFGSTPSTGAGSPLAAASPPPESTFNFASPPTTSASCPPLCSPEAQTVREMKVEVVSMYGPIARRQEKAALLTEAPGVTRLADLWCDKDPVWSLQLLQRVAPTVERLSVGNPPEDHLRAVHAMPRLRRLFVWGVAAALDAEPPALPPGPPGHDGLQWLRVWDIPLAMTLSLLRAHAGSLEELELLVGTVDNDKWPYSCGDLHSLLEHSRLRALRRLVLWRFRCSHEAAACTEQRAEVRRVLPGTEVLCGKCDHMGLTLV